MKNVLSLVCTGESFAFQSSLVYGRVWPLIIRASCSTKRRSRLRSKNDRKLSIMHVHAGDLLTLNLTSAELSNDCFDFLTRHHLSSFYNSYTSKQYGFYR